MEYRYNNAEPGHHHQWLAPILLKTIRSFKKPDEKLSLFDLGCGSGSLSALISRGGGLEVTGVDGSQSGIQIAASSFPDVRFIQGDIYDLPYKEFEGPFDIVMAVDVIEHLPSPRQFMEAVKKCLKPGGLLILTTPYHGYFKWVVLSMMGKMDNHLTTLWEGGHIKFWSSRTMKKLLGENGFHQIKFQFAGRMPFLWKSIICSAIFKP